VDQDTYQQILDDAIKSEKEAYAFYLAVAEKTQNSFLKELFLSFSEEERKHRQILQNLKDHPSKMPHFSDVPDYHVAETLETPELTLDMKPVDAIALAMKKEQMAMEHYAQLADACTDPDQRAVFSELATMEREHKHKMEAAFVDIGYPEVW
jgi:rubrerythrin